MASVPPPGAEEDFGCAASRLAGLAGVVFGWSPEVFWGATPADLAALVRAVRGDGARADGAPDAATVARLKEMHPDG